MNYEQAVARTRALDGRSDADKWEVAQHTFERTTGENAVTLTKWAQDCRFSRAYASNLRKTWDLFERKGTYARADRSFAECYEIASASRDRARELVDRAHRERKSVSTIRRSHPRERDDRELADRVLHDVDFQKRLRKRREWREFVEEEGERRRRQEKQPAPQVEDESTLARLEELKERTYRLLADMLDNPPPKQDRRRLVDQIEDIQVTLAWMQEFVKTGAHSFEDALEALLDGRLASPPGEPPALREEKPKKRETPPVDVAETSGPVGGADGTNGHTPPPNGDRPRRRRVGETATDPRERPKRRRRAG